MCCVCVWGGDCVCVCVGEWDLSLCVCACVRACACVCRDEWGEEGQPVTGEVRGAGRAVCVTRAGVCGVRRGNRRQVRGAGRTVCVNMCSCARMRMRACMYARVVPVCVCLCSHTLCCHTQMYYVANNFVSCHGHSGNNYCCQPPHMQVLHEAQALSKRLMPSGVMASTAS